MHLVYRFSETESPSLLTEALWKQKIAHQIIFNEGRNELWLVNAGQYSELKEIIEVWKEAPSALDNLQTIKTASPQQNALIQQSKKAPATIFFIVFAFFVALITQLGSNLSVVSYLTITSFEVTESYLHFLSWQSILSNHEYWRFLTPTFLYFNLVNLIFGVLWVWVVGSRLEPIIGSKLFFLGMLILAVVSNILEFQIDKTYYLSGLVSVMYGLIGFSWLQPLLNKRWPLIIPRHLMAFFVVMVAIGYTPIPESIGLGSMNNTAAGVGLSVGLLLGVIYFCVCKLLQTNHTSD